MFFAPNLRLRAVALLAEGVGRNPLRSPIVTQLSTSPSSRRAWVEIRLITCKAKCILVALLAEGVGRNLADQCAEKEHIASPSSRRAWVEIS